MIALAQHLRRSPYGLGRSVLLLIALTAALIIGLLAMHAMSSVTSHTTPAVTAVSMHEMDTAHGDAIQPVEEGCADCGGHEAMLAMACVLALLVVSVLFLLPRTGLTWVAPPPPGRTPHGRRPGSAVSTTLSSRSLRQSYVMAAR
ncbi:DUF6153 family protein [Microbacterium flavum]|uniref:DUF6153 family protein n=1 Tax=Microbacterium flavum TaxID=415216 RepID=UPI0024ADAED1|nr:DUF6153 family protein [Microbacterium flavum]